MSIECLSNVRAYYLKSKKRKNSDTTEHKKTSFGTCRKDWKIYKKKLWYKMSKKRNKMFQNYKLNVTIIIGYKMKL